uniref:Protein TsetseEP domain-containing protein n=1 Tax=Anopheles farauti TaxID=69004 RepID=A0A182Q2K8_9DIPT
MGSSWKHLRPSAVWLATAVIMSITCSGDAFPWPDFGIKNTIANSGRVQTAANELSGVFDNVNKHGIQLLSTYKVLSTARDVLYSISNDVATGGKALAAAIGTLATNTGSSIDAAFGAATGAITNMETTLTTSVAARLATLDSQIGAYVGKELRDSFTVLVTAGRKLSDALGRLKPAVQQLQSSAKSIPPTLMLSLLDALKNMQTNVPVVSYTMSTSLYNLELADKFIVDSTARAEQEIATIDTSYTTYSTETTGAANDMAESLRASIAEGYDKQVAAIVPIQTLLDASGDYTANFQRRMLQFQEVYGTEALDTLKATIVQRFDEYVQLMEELDNDVSDFFANDACPALLATVQELISSGPHAVFCFEKYSYLAYNLFHDFALLVNACYQEELGRLSALYLAAAPFVHIILFDVEDLADSLATCVRYSDSARCFSAITSYYEALLAQTTAKRYYLQELMARELEASSNRLASCYTVNKFFILQQVVNISTNVQLCGKNGVANTV